MKKLISRFIFLVSILFFCSFLLSKSYQQINSSTVTFAFLGDILIGRDVARHHQDGDWEKALSPLSHTLHDADIVIGNLESPICITDSCNQELANSSQIFNADDNSLSVNLCAVSDGLPMLKTAGIGFLSLTNNHASDCNTYESISRDEFAEFWSHSKITPIGLEKQPIHLIVNGTSFSLFSFDDVSKPMDLENISQQISQADKESDFVIVSVHWGHEYQVSPSDRQRNIAHMLAQSGADIIWGHHPHVLQTTEWIETNNNHLSFVAYSLGNALFDQVVPIDTLESAVLLITVDHDNVVNVTAIPFVIDPFSGSTFLAKGKVFEKIIKRLDFREP